MISLNDVRRRKDELRRVAMGPRLEEKPAGLGLVRFVVTCPEGTAVCLGRATEVLREVLGQSMTGWPSDDSWPSILPEWFVERCAPAQTPEQVGAWLAWWRKLSPKEQMRVEAEQRWALLDWLDWFKPGERQWYWWDTLPRDQATVSVAVEVDAWPFAWGALAWLFRAAGASLVAPEE